MHQDVAVEYVTRLLKGGIKLKDQNLQLKAYNNMKDNAEDLHCFFTKMVRVDWGTSNWCLVPVAEWLKTFHLQGSRDDWLKGVLISIAEVLKLQDLSTIQLHVVLMGTSFPDLRYIFNTVTLTSVNPFEKRKHL